MQLAIFDLDALLAGQTCDALWSRFLHGLGEADDAKVERCERTIQQYHAGPVVPEDYALAQAALLSARTRASLQPLREHFLAMHIRPRISVAVRQLLQQHADDGDTLLLTSVSCREIAEPIAALLGVDTMLCTRLVWFEGRCTGLLHGHPNMRMHKLARVHHWLREHGQSEATLRRASFYSSSINDLALLSAVGRPRVIDPGPRLAATAMHKGWHRVLLHRSPLRERPLDETPA